MVAKNDFPRNNLHNKLQNNIHTYLNKDFLGSEMFLIDPNLTNPKLNRTNTCGFVSIKNISVHPT